MMKTKVLISLLAVGLLSTVSSGYFTDDFTYVGDPTPLDARWTSDNSPSNPANSDLTIVNWGDGVAQSVPLNNLYNHLETSIDSTAGSFEVESNVRGNNPSSWAPSLMVYWDTTHWIRFAQFANFGLMYNDGNGEQNLASTAACGGWGFFTQRIEFTDSTIKFYGGVGPAPGDSPVTPTHIPAFDLVRGAWTKAAGALLIVGKGYQGWTYSNPDFDNDYISTGAADYLGIDYVYYTPEPATLTLLGLAGLGVLRRRRH